MVATAEVAAQAARPTRLHRAPTSMMAARRMEEKNTMIMSEESATLTVEEKEFRNNTFPVCGIF
ncbi:hypothetical protein [Parafrankia discariae]|uniref:hypothetical protein n=1 Tax=Parafrankia discariae TaxID=365528 RepID=UPI00037B792E|nr:hypothetical protein [Parafrankia discariae]